MFLPKSQINCNSGLIESTKSDLNVVNQHGLLPGVSAKSSVLKVTDMGPRMNTLMQTQCYSHHQLVILVDMDHSYFCIMRAGDLRLDFRMIMVFKLVFCDCSNAKSH